MWAETDTGWKFVIRYIECGSLYGQDEQGRWGGADIDICHRIASPMHEWKIGDWATFTEHRSDGDKTIIFRVSGIIYSDPVWLRSAQNPRQNYRANDCRYLKAIVTPPVPGGYHFWDVNEPSEYKTWASISADLDEAQQIAEAIAEKLNRIS